MFHLTVQKKKNNNSLPKFDQNKLQNVVQNYIERKNGVTKTSNTKRIIQQNQSNKQTSVFNDLMFKMQKNTSEFINYIGETKQYSMKMLESFQQIKAPVKEADSRANDKFILIEKGDDPILLWLGKVYSSCASTAFQLFYKNQLTYNETKAYCCEQILMNLLKHMKSEPNIQPKDLKILNDESRNIISHLCNKFPQTEQSDVNKKLKQAVKMMSVNNLESDDYDLVAKSGVEFTYKQDADYIMEIMKFLNYIIALTSQSKDGETNLQIFQKLMTKIFTSVQHKDQRNDIQQVIQTMNSNSHESYTKQTEEQIQYQQRVRSYTKFQIGNKISENLPLFSKYQIESGTLQTKSGSLIRVLDKWAQQLIDKFINAEKVILDRSYRYKKNNSSQKSKLNANSKKSLYRIIVEKLKNIQQFQQMVRKSINEIESIQGKSIQANLQSLDYVPQMERWLGQFACKMKLSSITYLVKSLNFYIHKLLQAIKNIRDNWNYLGQRVKDHPQFLSLDINLITFKIGDLLRCKCSSREQEILRILQTIQILGKHPNKLLKIVRVKDRLNMGTSDILINAWFNDTCLCEIQLAVISGANQKQSYFDKFNHFLYELKRAQLGPIMEMCMIWVINDPKSATFQKAIEQQTKRKQKNRDTACKSISFTKDPVIEQFPFICAICKIFTTNQKTMFENIKFLKTNSSICGQCFSTRINMDVRLKIIFRFFLKSFKFFHNFLPHFQQIDTFQTLSDQLFIILIPRNSRKINYHIVKIIEGDKQIFFANCRPTKGQLKLFTHFIINIEKKKEDYKKFFSQFLVFQWDLQTEFVGIAPQIKGKRELVQEYMNRVKQLGELEQNLECLSIVKDNIRLFLPYLNHPLLDIQERLIQQLNIKKINQIVQNYKEVIQMNKEQLMNEFNLLTKNVKLRINTTIKQIYIQNNNLQNVDFVSQMSVLTVLFADNNKIKKMPYFPASLQQIKLCSNNVSIIQGIGPHNINLKFIDLYQNKIKIIGNVFNNLPQLQIVYLLKNPLKKIERIINSPKIAKIGFGRCQIEKIENIDNFVNLQLLFLQCLKIRKIQNLSQNQKLRSLYLISMGLTKIQNVENLINIELFKANQNQINQIRGLDTLKNLKELNLKKNLIQIIKGLDKLHELRELDLSENIITKIQGLSKLQNLRVLKLKNNKINDIENLSSNQYLQTLDLSVNLISQIQGLSQLHQLKFLNLQSNIICILTNNIINLNNLEEFSAKNNAISQILAIPPRLKKIDLKKNQISNLEWLEDLSSECDIDITQNPIPQILKDTISQILLRKTILPQESSEGLFVPKNWKF